MTRPAPTAPAVRCARCTRPPSSNTRVRPRPWGFLCRPRLRDRLGADLAFCAEYSRYLAHGPEGEHARGARQAREALDRAWDAAIDGRRDGGVDAAAEAALVAAEARLERLERPRRRS